MDESALPLPPARPTDHGPHWWRARALGGLLLLLLGVGCFLSQREEMDRERANRSAFERPLPSGPRMRQVSVGFQGLLADWYWIQTLYYVGTRWREEGASGHLPPFPRLEPLLDLVIALDPHRLAAYHYGAFLLGGSNPEAAERIVRQGMRTNPQAWQIALDLGYLLSGANRYQEAAIVYREAAGLPGAPAWLSPMAAVMLARGGTPDLARQLLEKSCQATQDRFVQEVCQYQRQQLGKRLAAPTAP